MIWHPKPSDHGVPPYILQALDQLNRYAKTSRPNMLEGPRKAIYAYKTLALTRLVQNLLVIPKLIKVEAPCRNCGGTGTWTSWEDGRQAACRTCGQKGTVTLRFVEATLLNGLVWHTPWWPDGQGIAECYYGKLRPIRGYDFYVCDNQFSGLVPIEWRLETDWKPNQTTPVEMSSEDAAWALNEVEDWLVAAHEFDHPIETQGGVIRWRRAHDAYEAMRSYRLYLGRLGSTCFRCVMPLGERRLGHGCSTEWLAWSALSCGEHRDVGAADWPRMVPDEAITPNVRAWLEKPWRQLGRARRAA